MGIHCGVINKYLDSRRVESSTRFRGNDKLSQYLTDPLLDFQKTSCKFAKEVFLHCIRADNRETRCTNAFSNETERSLGNRKEIVVPVKQVWGAMVKEGKASNFAVPSLMADFECLLEGDKRFEFVSEKKSSAPLDPYSDDFFENDEMEKLGFSDNQKIKLRRIPSPVSDDDTESIDALDAAISMEELGEEFEDSALFDGGSASATRGTSGHRASSSAEKNLLKKISASLQKKSGKPAAKLRNGNPPQKIRKK